MYEVIILVIINSFCHYDQFCVLIFLWFLLHIMTLYCNESGISKQTKLRFKNDFILFRWLF